MVKVNVSEAKAHLGHYMKLAVNGERVVLCQRDMEKVELTPFNGTPPRGGLRNIGILKGMFTVPDDFNDPLPEFEEDFYNGKELKI